MLKMKGNEFHLLHPIAYSGDLHPAPPQILLSCWGSHPPSKAPLGNVGEREGGSWGSSTVDATPPSCMKMSCNLLRCVFPRDPAATSAVHSSTDRYASEQILVRYAKIAKQLLQEKTVRDVAMRCRWMMKKESRKRRKEDLARKSEEKDRVTGPSPKPPAHLAPRPSAPPYALSMLHIENDDEISYPAIGGVTGQLLERNTHVFNQISTNLHNYQIQGNFSLFCHTRDNILKILNDMNDMLEIMKEMPPLPVKVNEELANSILPRTTMPMQT